VKPSSRCRRARPCPCRRARGAKAAIIDDFRQVEPDTGQPGSERTVVRVLYDSDNIYFGIYLYDHEPDKIIVKSMTRDGPVFAEDFFRLVLDPNMTRRDGYSGGRRFTAGDPRMPALPRQPPAGPRDLL